MNLSNKFSGYYPSGWFFMADDWIGLAEPTTINKRVDVESVAFGTTTVMRERMQIAGITSGAIAPVSSVTGLSVAISGNSTASISTVSAIRIKSTAAVTVTGTSNVSGSTVVLTTVSGVRIKSTAAISIQGNTTVAGNTTAIISTVSAVRIKSTVAINVSGSTVVLTTVSGVRIKSTAALSIQGNTTVAGNTTAIISTVSVVRVESGSTVLAVTGTSNVSGSTVLANQGAAGGITSAWSVVSYQASSQVLAGSTGVTVQRAAFGTATSGALTVVSSVANTFIRVLGWNIVSASTNVVTWFSATTAGSTLAGPYHLAANGGMVVPVSEYGWFQTTAISLGLVLKQEVASSIGGSVVYLQSSAIA